MKIRVLTLAVLLASPQMLPAQTTGRIAGNITDATDQALPGATVTARSPSLY